MAGEGKKIFIFKDFLSPGASSAPQGREETMAVGKSSVDHRAAGHRLAVNATGIAAEGGAWAGMAGGVEA